jgi:hypothetical protein
LLVFLNFEEEDILTSIDTILYSTTDTSNNHLNFKLASKPIKENLNSFLDELKAFLTKLQVLNKFLIVCISRADITYLKEKAKKNTIRLPNLFQRNIILLNASDFSDLQEGEISQALEIFQLQYILDNTTINKIQIQL